MSNFWTDGVDLCTVARNPDGGPVTNRDDANISTAIGLLGCGSIAERYVVGMRRFPNLTLAGCADVIPAAAVSLSERTGIHAYASVDELLADPAIDIVVNITPPVVHEEMTRAAVAAGKHVYVEKPITTDPATATSVLDDAQLAGIVIGAAPDTFLGSAAQTARRALDEGVIGNPIGAVAAVRYSRAEEWHPDPSFLFRPGGGPSLDLGPYYVTALVNLLGPVAEVSAFSRIGAVTREFTAPERRADSVEVTVPTHASASLRFVDGAIATLISSFDIWDTSLPFLEVYGDKGTLQLGDPNEYDSDVRVKRHSDTEWQVLPPVLEPTGEPETPVQLLRGIGVDDLARALHDPERALRGHGPRASGALAQHVLEIIAAIDESSARSEVIAITSRVDRPKPVA